MEYARQYVSIPLFNFQSLGPSKFYRTAVMSDLHRTWEPEQWEKARTWRLIPARIKDWRDATSVLLGSMTMGLLIVVSIPSLWRDRRIRLPLLCVTAALAGSLVEVVQYPHYVAPATAALFIVMLEALRHLRQWTPGGKPSGRLLSRALPALVLGAAVGAQGVVILRQEPPVDLQPQNARRDEVAQRLIADQPGSRHVILVRYTGTQSPHEEWTYNSADIDSQDVIWAHDLGSAENVLLLEYYKERKIWLLQPDINPRSLDSYP
jgi:hypothetical protein